MSNYFQADFLDSYYYGYPHVKKLLNAIRKPGQLKKFLASLDIDPKEISIQEINQLVANANNPRVLKQYLDNISGNSNGDLNFVDLGLPSGTLWAKMNIGATNKNEAGLYYSWANTEGHTPGDNYSFIQNNYELTTGYSIGTKVITNSDYDVALLETDGQQRIPSQEEFYELIDNCTVVFTEAVGWTFTSNINGKTIFFPVTGYMNATNLSYHDFDGCYWANEKQTENGEDTHAYCMYLNIAENPHVTSESRRFGFCIRGVKATATQSFVDLGLPSGTLWATMNVGASKPEEYGGYFAWGESIRKGNYNESSYFDQFYTEFGDSGVYTLPYDYDAAYQYLGEDFAIPTREQFQELTSVRNTTKEWIEIDGICGIKFTSKTNGNSIFLPAAGKYTGTNIIEENTNGEYAINEIDEYVQDAYTFEFDISGGYVHTYPRISGISVRPVKNTIHSNILKEEDRAPYYNQTVPLKAADWIPNAQINRQCGIASYAGSWCPIVVDRIENGHIFIGLEYVYSDSLLIFGEIKPSANGYTLTNVLETAGGAAVHIILYNKQMPK